MLSIMIGRSAKAAFALVLMSAATASGPSSAQTASAQTPSTAPASKIEDQPSFIVVGVTVRTNNAAEAGEQGKIPQMWQAVMQNGTLEPIPNKAGDALVVVYSGYAGDHTGDYDYTLGYRVTSADKVPVGMVARTIAAGKYAVFNSDQGPPQEVVAGLWQRINSMTPQQLGGTRAYQTDFETYADVTDWSNMHMTAHIGLR
jgi:predicted transcriptional regulator YdeE